ncbi:MAG: ABC transporter ATP-binding protein [Acetobacteraceae bacterium]|nr:ABC transporter ATP-binding protein [Acetobacteraceae bacterium]
MLLRARALVASYEPGLPIVRGADVSVASGEIVVLLGPNGAGKSTLVKAIAGLVPIFGGAVELDGRDITAVPAHLLVRHGLAFVPQTENVFAAMSVADNLGLAAAVLPRARRAERIESALALFPDLRDARRRAAGRLSGGQRQMLSIARALIPDPRALVLDEPSAGLSPKLVGLVMGMLAEIRASGLAVLLVEQNARAALAVADRACILVEGRVAYEGAGAGLLSDPAVARLYLGVRRDAAA